MSNQVWSLSVDLQTKTATFSTGLADAARNARGSFQDIKSGAAEMGRSTSGSMGEARHGVMLLGEEFGVHLPRALTSFIASIGPVGEAMSAAFPFLAILVGATLLLEHLSKLKEAGEKLTQSQTNFGTTVANVLGGLNDKLLEAGIRTDELNHDHLGALEKQLQLIDHASLKDLTSAFETLAKGADLTFAQLKTSWYQFGAGSTGAKHALEEFKAQYDSLLAKGKEGQAADLLAGTRKSAEHVLALQKLIQDSAKAGATAPADGGLQLRRAYNELQEKGAGYTDKEIMAQETLVDALQAQEEVQGKVNALKAAQSSNAVQTTGDKIGGDQDKAAREQAANQRKADEEAEKAQDEAYKLAVAGLQESERQKIEATKEGSSARLAAIDSAIKEEESKGLQAEGFYRGLLTARVNETRQMQTEMDKLRAEAGKEDAEHTGKMGELQLAAEKSQDALYLSSLRNAINERVAVEKAGAEEEFQVKQTALHAEIAALDQTTNEYQNKLKALQDKEQEMVREHENRVTQLEEQAEEQRNARILSAEQRRNDAIAKGLTEGITRQESWGKMMRSIGDQVATGLLENAIKSMLADDMTKERDAAAAARKAYLAGMQFPFPANLVMGPTLGALAFASVMAFQDGGIVPGTGRGDVVPAMLEPGEGVLSTKVMAGLKDASQGNAGGGDVHIHAPFQPQIHAVDAEGVDRMLTKHHQVFQKHLVSHARKMNQ